MQSIAPLPAAWQTWIHDNLARGCLHQDMAQSMVRAGIDAHMAQQAIQAARTAVQPPPAAQAQAAYVMETPRLPQNCNFIRTHDRDVRVSMRLSDPVMAVFDDFMSHEECDELVQLSRAKLSRSAIVNPMTGLNKIIDDRSSYGTFFSLAETDFIARLDRRIAEVMHWPMENGEGIQILHYPAGGEYKAHFDYFPQDDPGSAIHLAQGGQRVSTLVMYLNDVEEGGGTAFPAIHLTVTPKKGSAAYFEYCNSQGQVDPRSLHSGMPIIRGEKWIATKWMRQGIYSA
jgi:prolyl 4-hydroxylase